MQAVALVEQVGAQPPGHRREPEAGQETVDELQELVDPCRQAALQSVDDPALRAERPVLVERRGEHPNRVAAPLEGPDQLLDVDELAVLGGEPMVVEDPQGRALRLSAHSARTASNSAICPAVVGSQPNRSA